MNLATGPSTGQQSLNRSLRCSGGLTSAISGEGVGLLLSVLFQISCRWLPWPTLTRNRDCGKQFSSAKLTTLQNFFFS